MTQARARQLPVPSYQLPATSYQLQLQWQSTAQSPQHQVAGSKSLAKWAKSSELALGQMSRRAKPTCRMWQPKLHGKKMCYTNVSTKKNGELQEHGL